MRHYSAMTTHIKKLIDKIEAAANMVGTTELAKAAGISNRTLRMYRSTGYNTKTIEHLSALEKAAENWKSLMKS